MINSLPTDLLISITQIREQAVTVNMVGHYPPHIAKLGTMHAQRLLRGGVFKLPKDAAGVRIQLELANNKGGISWESHQLVQSLVADIQVPGKFSAAERRAALELFNNEYVLID